jgi:hypothetical protein
MHNRYYISGQASNNIKNTKNRIDSFYNNKNSINLTDYSRLKDKFKNQLQENLLLSTQDTPFQIQGGFDELGFIFSYQNTLELILSAYNTKHSEPDLKLEVRNLYTLVEYEYFQFKLEGKKSFSKTQKSKELEKEFELLKENNLKQIQFLKDQQFNNEEINIILNLFTINKYNSINLRHINNLKKIDYYTCCAFRLN